MIELQAVTKVYRSGRREVASLRGINLRIPAGGFLAIMGPSGSGKSTLLHLIGGLDRPTSGRIRFQGTDLSDLSDDRLASYRRREVGFVFQQFNLLPTLRVVENVALPLRLAGVGESESRSMALESLEWLGLSARAGHRPEELSGGEQQRVAIARALVSGPELILCDEPTGSLDSATGRDVLARLRDLPEPGRRSVVMVTHDPSAAAWADRVIHVRDGRVESEDRTIDAIPVA